MTTYWVFAYDTYYPDGGMLDLRMTFPNMELAQQAAADPDCPWGNFNHCYMVEVKDGHATDAYWVYRNGEWIEAEMTIGGVHPKATT